MPELEVLIAKFPLLVDAHLPESPMPSLRSLDASYSELSDTGFGLLSLARPQILRI